MPVKARLGTILLLLVVIALYLPGCQVSGDGDGDGAVSDTGSIRLTLSTTTGSTFLVADGSSSVTVQLTVTDASGRGVSNTPVTFTIDPTNLGSLSASASTTDASGVAQTTLTAGTQVGTAQVTAQAMGFSTAININFISGTPAQVAVRAVPSTVGVGTTSTLVATVSTATGAFVEGISVTFTLAVNNSGARLSSTSGTTNASGQASITYTAGLVIGTDTVRASVPGDIVGAVAVSVQATTVNAAALELLVSSPQIDSDGSETVTLTALVGDANRNVVAGVPVTFVVDAGCDVACIQVTTGTTNASGRATAVLDTGGDPTNRTITITAVAGTFTSTNTVTVTGTTITISGAGALVLGQTTTLSILLRDSGGNGIPNEVVTLSSTRGNTLNPATTVTTDFNGQASVTVTAAVSGIDTISATALGATGTFSLTVSSANFRFITPTANAQVNLGASQTITVRWEESGAPVVPPQTINFFATRGTLSAASAVTNSSGDASVTISSTNAGPSAITATAATAGGPSSQLTIEFVATTPTSLILQANPTTLGVNAGGSTDQQSIITAIVRDASGNLVKNQIVSFRLTDVSSGSIFPASAITDSFGRASTVYTAGAVPSAQDGVVVDAEVVSPVPATPCTRNPAVGVPPGEPVSGPCDRVTLTVTQQALFVVLGTGNTLRALSETQYAKPYSALVTDANGNPVAGARVELNLYPTRYQKGRYIQLFMGTTFLGWGKSLTIPAGLSGDDADQACDNEDLNRNGILDPAPIDLDTNGNGRLDPGNIAEVPINGTTDAIGFFTFDVVYTKDMTWVEVELEARVTVAGSESFTRARFFLSGLASDFNNQNVAPPGVISPFGTATTCASPS